jgi:hypothetical protein
LQVPELVDHQRIHALLLSTFCTHPLWGENLILYDVVTGGRLCFFPIDNTARPDPAANQLRAKLAAVISAEQHVRRRVPFTWLQLLDLLRDSAKDRLSMTLSEVLAMAKDCGMGAADEVLLALQLFNELGLLMHHQEPALRDLVVLDPAAFVIEPASRLVCQHGLHYLPQHADAEAELPLDYNLLRYQGRASRGLLRVLWRDRVQNLEHLERLMVRYGLMFNSAACSAGEEYIVPALLPRLRQLPRWQARAVILFGVEKQLGPEGAWLRQGFVTAQEVAIRGFLPGGLFAQVLPLCLLL